MTEIDGLRPYERLGAEARPEGVLRPGGLGLTQRALALGGVGPGARVLDLGCGTGAALRYMVDHLAIRGVGIDPSAILLGEGSRKNPGLALVRASGDRLPFGEAVMDAALAECSLSAAKGMEAVLRECSRVLKPRGPLLVNDLYARKTEGASALKELPSECRLAGALTSKEWMERIDACGFTVTRWEDHSSELREYAARLVFAHGSREAFWRRFQGAAPGDGAGEILEAVSKAAPGYFLLIAHKKGAIP
jgi:ubiquinone/menaquinone biosynthesis C-methylase UbiE